MPRAYSAMTFSSSVASRLPFRRIDLGWKVRS